MSAAAAVERALRKDDPRAAKSYDPHALAIARVLVRHYADEAEALLERVKLHLDEARRSKR